MLIKLENGNYSMVEDAICLSPLENATKPGSQGQIIFVIYQSLILFECGKKLRLLNNWIIVLSFLGTIRMFLEAKFNHFRFSGNKSGNK